MRVKVQRRSWRFHEANVGYTFDLGRGEIEFNEGPNPPAEVWDFIDNLVLRVPVWQLESGSKSLVYEVGEIELSDEELAKIRALRAAR